MAEVPPVAVTGVAASGEPRHDQRRGPVNGTSRRKRGERHTVRGAVAAWRVHLGMPMCGARMVDGRLDAAVELARKDALLAFLAPFTHQAAEEFPAALAALREQLPVDDKPVSIVGASLGGAVALQVLTAGATPIRAVALVNPAVLITVPDLAHPLAEEPGLEPAPQLPATRTVDEILTRWFVRQLAR